MVCMLIDILYVCRSKYYMSIEVLYVDRQLLPAVENGTTGDNYATSLFWVWVPLVFSRSVSPFYRRILILYMRDKLARRIFIFLYIRICSQHPASLYTHSLILAVTRNRPLGGICISDLLLLMSTTVRLDSVRTRYFRYFWKTGTHRIISLW